jgi:mRNA interferase RelE/StbE
VISESAAKELVALDKKRKEFLKRLSVLNEDPFSNRSKADIKKLHGLKNPELYRLRIGDFRVVYFVEKNTVKITHILKRGNVYDALE